MKFERLFHIEHMLNLAAITTILTKVMLAMNKSESHIRKIVRLLKNRLQFDFLTLNGYEKERKTVVDVLKRTIEFGESNSMLIVGPRNVGKTTFINAVLLDLLELKDAVEDTLFVHLNGNLDTDDRIALQSITLQLNLELAVDGKVFGSFAENLSFLLESLKRGNERSKSVIFFLEEFDLFCAHHNQTLLYNLFDVAQSAQAPISVLGITCRLDVVELLEKRVKSRFSHRQVFLHPKADAYDDYLLLFSRLLSLPENNELQKSMERILRFQQLPTKEFPQFLPFHVNMLNVDKKLARHWNKGIQQLIENAEVRNVMQSLYDYDLSEAYLKQFVYKLVSQLSDDRPKITVEQVTKLVEESNHDDKVKLLMGLSVLELCMVICIKHHSEIYDRDPFNFEIIYTRFLKFAKTCTTMQNIERKVALRAYEHLTNIELILPASGQCCKGQKEFSMHNLALTYSQINEAAQNYYALPTEIMQWSINAI